MNHKEKWTLLLSEKRFRPKSETIESDGRNTFENDYGRLISSSPIRRLQDKTQVFPLEESDYIRTRLTHSLEVSYLASSIGQSIENLLIDRNELDPKLKGNLSSLLRVGGLVHDLGNPPFGHFGEEAIKEYFERYFENDSSSTLNSIEKEDFKNFDGNVQTLRILSKLYYFGDEFGFNLNYSSLASIIKYPSNSLEGNKKFLSQNEYEDLKPIDKIESTFEIAKKKFGFFQSEEQTFNEINKYLNLDHRRHPVVYLLEAADDIAYSAADIEDGIKLGKITLNDIEKVFSDHLDENKDIVLLKLNDLRNNDSINYDTSLIVQRFRIFTQQMMIDGIVKSFNEEYENIMQGKLENEIIDISPAKD